MLPEDVLLQAQQDILNWQNQGLSILEVGHRTEAFTSLVAETELLVRQILNVPNNYRILFLGGAARAQFANIPANFLHAREKAAYIVTGTWSEMAYEEAQKCFSSAYCVATASASNFTDLPVQCADIMPSTKYLYFCPNETIHGVRFLPPQSMNSVPWVADMTSCLFSEPIDVSQYGLIFAGAQKNIANAGLTLVIVRQEWLDEPPWQLLPTMLDLRTHAQHNSLFATPPTFNIYLANLMLHWLNGQGGLQAIYEANQSKAKLLYSFLDTSAKYRALVKPQARSIMNVCFTSDINKHDLAIINQAENNGLYGLKGHRLLGGLRASIYNAMPISGVEKLIAFLENFVND